MKDLFDYLKDGAKPADFLDAFLTMSVNRRSKRWSLPKGIRSMRLLLDESLPGKLDGQDARLAS